MRKLIRKENEIYMYVQTYYDIDSYQELYIVIDPWREKRFLHKDVAHEYMNNRIEDLK